MRLPYTLFSEESKISISAFTGPKPRFRSADLKAGAFFILGRFA